MKEAGLEVYVRKHTMLHALLCPWLYSEVPDVVPGGHRTGYHSLRPAVDFEVSAFHCSELYLVRCSGVMCSIECSNNKTQVELCLGSDFGLPSGKEAAVPLQFVGATGRITCKKAAAWLHMRGWKHGFGGIFNA